MNVSNCFANVATKYKQILTEQQHLDLIPLQHFVLLQLILYLLIPLLALLLLCAHAATHLGGGGEVRTSR